MQQIWRWKVVLVGKRLTAFDSTDKLDAKIKIKKSYAGFHSPLFRQFAPGEGKHHTVRRRTHESLS